MSHINVVPHLELTNRWLRLERENPGAEVWLYSLIGITRSSGVGSVMHSSGVTGLFSFAFLLTFTYLQSLTTTPGFLTRQDKLKYTMGFSDGM